MADLPRRQLGRTGLDVTMLGYGAMGLRGAPRGPRYQRCPGGTAGLAPQRV